MLTTLILGIVLGVAFTLLFRHVEQNKLKVTWWEWTLTILALLFTAFTAEVLYVFLAEGAAQAAMVTGLILGLVAVIWLVLLGRFTFFKQVTTK